MCMVVRPGICRGPGMDILPRLNHSPPRFYIPETRLPYAANELRQLKDGLTDRPTFVLADSSTSSRLDRTSDAQEQSRLNRSIFHLPDGPEQRARDAEMRRAMAAEFAALERAGGHPASASASSADGETLMVGNPNQWADRRKSERQFSYDADGAVHGWWTAGGRALLEEARARTEAASKAKAKL